MNSSVQADTIVFSFVATGCNRVDQKDVTNDNPSTANLVQLKRTFSDILALRPVPRFFFFTGDMVVGYTNDTDILKSQLSAWTILYEQSGLRAAGVSLVPLPGNHETLPGKGLPASLAAERIWLNVMKPYIQNNNGPKIGEADNLSTDESQITYSFDYVNTHFLVLNTDGPGKESQVPYRWISADLESARKNGAKHMIAFSHKPAFPYPQEDGLSSNLSARDSFWNALEVNHAELLISAHNHLYYRVQPNTGKTWQIIAGNGGSSLSALINSSDQQFFGFCLVNIYQSGKILLKSYGRKTPSAGYLESTDNISTLLKDSLIIQ